MNRWLNVTWSLTLSAFGSASCAPIPRARERFDEGLIATVYDAETSFGEYATFSVAPRVATADIATDGTITTGQLDQVTSDAIVAQVVALMEERGYALVETTEVPELGIAIGAVKGWTTRSVATGYWSANYGGYWGYPGAMPYYGFASSYSYRTGSLVIDMLDLKHTLLRPVASDESDAGTLAGRRGIEVVWTAVAYKALPELTVGSGDVSAAIEQVFLQSPYLHR
jgi:hypothetical protein